MPQLLPSKLEYLKQLKKPYYATERSQYNNFAKNSLQHKLTAEYRTFKCPKHCKE